MKEFDIWFFLPSSASLSVHIMNFLWAIFIIYSYKNRITSLTTSEKEIQNVTNADKIKTLHLHYISDKKLELFTWFNLILFGLCLHFDDSIWSWWSSLFQGRQLTCCRGFQSPRSTTAAKTGAQHRLNNYWTPPKFKKLRHLATTCTQMNERLRWISTQLFRQCFAFVLIFFSKCWNWKICRDLEIRESINWRSEANREL